VLISFKFYYILLSMATKNKIITGVPYSKKVQAQALRRANQSARAQRSDAGKKRKP
jgi:hypothetical protein